MSATPTEALKAILYDRFGHKDHPAEWDGNNLGGGKLSQRYWEYFQTIEYLDLTGYAKVLDIGGVSPHTKRAFFAELVRNVANEVVVMDPNEATFQQYGLHHLRGPATYDSLRSAFDNFDITHVSCVSVLEHIEPTERFDLMRGLNAFFKGDTLALTVEYHPKTCYFDYQLTAATLDEMLKPLTKFYLSEFTSSPVWCENAFTPEGVPLWRPLAIRLR